MALAGALRFEISASDPLRKFGLSDHEVAFVPHPPDDALICGARTAIHVEELVNIRRKRQSRPQQGRHPVDVG